MLKSHYLNWDNYHLITAVIPGFQMFTTFTVYEPRHDKTNKVSVRLAKTQISLGIRPVWSDSSLSAWRNLGFLATHWTHSEDSDQTGRMPRLIWVFAGRTLTLSVLSCRGSYTFSFQLPDGDLWFSKVWFIAVPIVDLFNNLLVVKEMMAQTGAAGLEYGVASCTRRLLKYIWSWYYLMCIWTNENKHTWTDLDQLLANLWAPENRRARRLIWYLLTWHIQCYWTKLGLSSYEPRQANLCLRTFRHDKL